MKFHLFVAALLLTARVAPALAQDLSDASVAGEERRYFGAPIDLSLRDADLVEVLGNFAKIGHFNLVLQPGIEGKVTVELKQVPWDQALEQILKINNLGMEVTTSAERGRELHIASRSEILARRERLRSPATLSLALRHADATVVARTLGRPDNGILGPRGLVRVEPGNRLEVHDTGARVLDVGQLLARIDLPAAADEEPAALEARCLAVWQELQRE